MNLNVRLIPVKTYCMEMTKKPVIQEVDLNEDFLILRAEKPTIDFYKFLFISLGKEWGWTSRLLLTEEELKREIEDPLIEIYVLYHKGVPAGYFELNKRKKSEVNLSYFGLFREFIGKGLGKKFISFVLNKAWSSNPEKVILNTCEYDHPAALPLYLKIGFKIDHEEIRKEIYPVDFIINKLNKI
jgi:GNAT superfamily N-acetyltransferase